MACVWPNGSCASPDATYSPQDLVRLSMRCGIHPNGPNGLKKPQELCAELVKKIDGVGADADTDHELKTVAASPSKKSKATKGSKSRITLAGRRMIPFELTGPGADPELQKRVWALFEEPILALEPKALGFQPKRLPRGWKKAIQDRLQSQSPQTAQDVQAFVDAVAEHIVKTAPFTAHFEYNWVPRMVVVAMLRGRVAFNNAVVNYESLVQFVKKNFVDFSEVWLLSTEVENALGIQWDDPSRIQTHAEAYKVSADELIQAIKKSVKPLSASAQLKLLQNQLYVALHQWVNVTDEKQSEILEKMIAALRQQVEDIRMKRLVMSKVEQRRDAKRKPFCVQSFSEDSRVLDVDDPDVVTIIYDRKHNHRRHCYVYTDLERWFKLETPVYWWSQPAVHTWEPGGPLLGKLYKLPLNGVWVTAKTANRMSRGRAYVMASLGKQYLGALDHTSSAVWNQHQEVFDLVSVDEIESLLPFDVTTVPRSLIERKVMPEVALQYAPEVFAKYNVSAWLQGPVEYRVSESHFKPPRHMDRYAIESNFVAQAFEKDMLRVKTAIYFGWGMVNDPQAMLTEGHALLERYKATDEELRQFIEEYIDNFAEYDEQEHGPVQPQGALKEKIDDITKSATRFLQKYFPTRQLLVWYAYTILADYLTWTEYPEEYQDEIERLSVEGKARQKFSTLIEAIRGSKDSGAIDLLDMPVNYRLEDDTDEFPQTVEAMQEFFDFHEPRISDSQEISKKFQSFLSDAVSSEKRSPSDDEHET